MSIQLRGNDDSVFSNDIVAPNIPTQGSIVGYQQGAWTLSSAVGTISVLRPYWSRIGNTVFVTCYVSEFSNRTSTTKVAITGLPYAGLADYNNVVGPVMAQYIDNGENGGWSTYLSEAASLQFYRTSSTGWQALKYSALNNATAGLHFCATYLTDDTTWTPINGATVQ